LITVLKGGLDEYDPLRFNFIAGEVTNTRLMGVVVMYAGFVDTKLNKAIHIFIYYDYEELGIDHINILDLEDSKDLAKAFSENFAGLGGDLIDIDEYEARYLAQWMVNDTRKKKQPLVPEVSEIEFMLKVPEKLTADEKKKLDQKMCVPIKTDYGLLNYYLMRCFGKDEEGMKLLEGHGEFEEIAPKLHSTFLLNKSELKEGATTQHKTYRCESIVEVDEENTHHHIISEIDLYKKKITGARKISDMAISEYEAGLMLNKAEYVTVYELKDKADVDSFVDELEDFVIGMTQHMHPAGAMFIDFNKDNSHAESKVFHLSNDVNALFFATLTGQLVVASYSLNGIMDTETKVYLESIGKFLNVKNRYSFAASIIYDFAESGCSDFNEFLDKIK